MTYKEHLEEHQKKIKEYTKFMVKEYKTKYDPLSKHGKTCDVKKENEKKPDKECDKDEEEEEVEEHDHFYPEKMQHLCEDKLQEVVIIDGNRIKFVVLSTNAR